MSESSATPSPVVVVTGANGLVGSRTCAALVERGATVRAVVRRPGTAPAARGRRGVGRRLLRPRARGGRGRGRERCRHDRPPDGDGPRDPAPDRGRGHAGPREGGPGRRSRAAGPRLHRGRLRPLARRRRRGRVVPAGHRRRRRLRRDQARHRRRPGRRSTGSPASSSVRRRSSAPGETSVWNSVRPADVRDDEEARHAVPGQSFAWVHVDDLAALAADVATGRVETSTDPGERTGRGRVHRRQRRRRPGRRPATTTRRSPGRSASSRSGTTSPRGPAGSWPGAPTAGAGRRPWTSTVRWRRSPTGCAASRTVPGLNVSTPARRARCQHHGRPDVSSRTSGNGRGSRPSRDQEVPPHLGPCPGQLVPGRRLHRLRRAGGHHGLLGTRSEDLGNIADSLHGDGLHPGTGARADRRVGPGDRKHDAGAAQRDAGTDRVGRRGPAT